MGWPIEQVTSGCAKTTHPALCFRTGGGQFQEWNRDRRALRPCHRDPWGWRGAPHPEPCPLRAQPAACRLPSQHSGTPRVCRLNRPGSPGQCVCRPIQRLPGSRCVVTRGHHCCLIRHLTSLPDPVGQGVTRRPWEGGLPWSDYEPDTGQAFVPRVHKDCVLGSVTSGSPSE